MKKILFTILTFFICFNVYADEFNDSLTRTRDNLGVNKPVDINENSINHILNTPLVDVSKKVYDFSDVLTDEQENDLRTKALEFLDKTGIEIVIVTINTEWSDYEIENFADDFFDYNDFGITDKSKSFDGILAVRNTNDYNRYYYISTSGTGQMYFPQDRVDYILDYMYDNMHYDNYYEGFKDFIRASNSKYNDGIPSKYEDCYVDEKGDLYDKNGNQVSWEKGIYVVPYGSATFIGLVVSIIVVSILVSKNKMVKKAVNAKDYLDEKSLNFTKKTDTFIKTHTSSYTVSSSSGSSGGGSHHSSSGFSHGGGGRHC